MKSEKKETKRAEKRLLLGAGNVKGFDVCVLMAVAAASTVNILATL